MTDVKRNKLTSEETSKLLSHCCSLKGTTYVAKLIKVPASRVSEGKNGNWRLDFEQKKALENEFGIMSSRAGKFMHVQLHDSLDSFLNSTSTYDFINKTKEYFSYEVIKEFSSNGHLDALLNEKASTNWFNFVISREAELTSLSDLYDTTLYDLDNLPAVKEPQIKISSLENTLFGLEASENNASGGDNLTHNDNGNSYFNVVKDHYDGECLELDLRFWISLLLLIHFRTHGYNGLSFLQDNPVPQVQNQDVVIVGDEVWSVRGEIDIYHNRFMHKMINENHSTAFIGGRWCIDAHLESCTAHFTLFITKALNYHFLVELNLPQKYQESYLNKDFIQNHSALIIDIDKGDVLNQIQSICKLLQTEIPLSTVKEVLAQNGAYLPETTYFY